MNRFIALILLALAMLGTSRDLLTADAIARRSSSSPSHHPATMPGTDEGVWQPSACAVTTSSSLWRAREHHALQATTMAAAVVELRAADFAVASTRRPHDPPYLHAFALLI